MRLALAQARRVRGRTFPNPPVGAVVYRGDRVLGRGATRAVGQAHAEVVAIERARAAHGATALRGASLAVTLEPCAHQGRSGPCAEVVAECGFATVAVGHVDPYHEVAGRGLRRVRRSGAKVQVGVLEEACREQHRGFLSVVNHGRPFVVVKLASTLDGRIATAKGESRWITGPEARAAVHRLRAVSDAVMVGSQTALADDPRLDARRGERVVHRPVRVLVDSALRVAPDARLFEGPNPAWVVCSGEAPARRRNALVDAGAKLLPIGRGRGRVDLRGALRRLAREGLTELLVEGGGGLAAALLRAGLVDEVHWFSAPRLLGADGVPALAELGVGRLARAPELSDIRIRRVGADVHWSGRVLRKGRAS